MCTLSNITSIMFYGVSFSFHLQKECMLHVFLPHYYKPVSSEFICHHGYVWAVCYHSLYIISFAGLMAKSVFPVCKHGCNRNVMLHTICHLQTQTYDNNIHSFVWLIASVRYTDNLPNPHKSIYNRNIMTFSIPIT